MLFSDDLRCTLSPSMLILQGLNARAGLKVSSTRPRALHRVLVVGILRDLNLTPSSLQTAEGRMHATASVSQKTLPSLPIHSRTQAPLKPQPHILVLNPFNGGFPKLGCLFLGVLIVFWGLHWGPLISITKLVNLRPQAVHPKPVVALALRKASYQDSKLQSLRERAKAQPGPRIQVHPDVFL